MNQMTLIFIVYGLCFALAVAAWFSWKRYQNLRYPMTSVNESVPESLYIIAASFLQGQVEAAEACLRIYKLLEIYWPAGELRPQKMHVFHQMYAEIKDFDTLEARNALSLQEVTKQDSKRFEIEDRYQAQLMEGCQELIEHLRTAPWPLKRRIRS